ncbi:MAG TPA: nucleotide disphospho-sugar-binding domain-containing protein [Thermoleophilaceae bacterium]|nr:nucleotide disphospho-sugar-binding domain-containing protein [Thermoleophilaceae bacterium]
MARGHSVCLQTWGRWQGDVEREGVAFAPAPEYEVWPNDGAIAPYRAAVKAAGETVPLIRQLDPHVVVADILTVAGSLAAQMEGRRWATLVPHVLPTSEPGLPPYSVGARLPRTRAGSAMWGLWRPFLGGGEERGRVELNGARERVGLAPLGYPHGGISRELAIVATFPQLEYPRHGWDPSVRVTGPLLWEQPYPEIELPPGDEPLVLVAPSTSQDPDGRLLRAALDGLAREPVRVIATTNRRAAVGRLRPPTNARVVDWLSYARTMPRCAAVVCHAGHGTVARALAGGVPVVGCPAAGDMAENAARVAWSGCGVSLPRRLVTARGLRLAVRTMLADPAYGERAARLRAWAERHDGGEMAARALEGLGSA